MGTSNKTQQEYLSDLQVNNVRVVVDVRGYPRSRYFPHFNQKNMQQWLKAAGIEYVWLGETLGNPKDAKGKRTLEGFQEYMQSETYRQGLDQLQQILQSSKGRVVITCSEGNQDDCHRKFILGDLAQSERE